MTEYILALVLKKDLEYPGTCLECDINPEFGIGAITPIVPGGCRFRDFCGDGVFKAEFAPTNSLNLVSIETANKRIDKKADD